MNLYKISQTVNEGYDTFDAAIVAAESTERARVMHPGNSFVSGGITLIWNADLNSWVWSNALDEPSMFSMHDWAKPDDVQVELIGVATADIHEGIVLASFNAG